MGLIRAKILLANPRRPELAPVETDALADLRSIHLCIPQTIQQELGLVEIERKKRGPRRWQ